MEYNAVFTRMSSESEIKRKDPLQIMAY